jgi:DNA processing protein
MSILSLGGGHREVLVTLALMRLGTDTKASRILNEVYPWRGEPGPAGPALLEVLCDALEIPQEGRASRLAALRRRAQDAIARTTASGFAIVTVWDAGYPAILRHIPDPPIALWTRGDGEAIDRPAVAIVGSRRASSAGLAMATQLARDVSRAGLVVVSGLARGIDGAAHRGALDTKGPTIAVLGNGVDIVYPAEHRELSDRIMKGGALVSEFPPGTPSYANHFPLRNRIISGLSRAVVVVEAGERSGSLITARAALEQGRDVLAVPGLAAGGGHRGCHRLIKDGARLVESVEDILEEIRWRRPQVTPSIDDNNGKQVSKLEAFLRTGEVVTVDDLASRSGQPAARVLAELGRLELAGRVARMAGGTFARLD